MLSHEMTTERVTAIPMCFKGNAEEGYFTFAVIALCVSIHSRSGVSSAANRFDFFQ